MSKERNIGSFLGGKVFGRFIELDVPDNLIVVGDLHGDLRSLQAILKNAYYDNFFENKRNKLVFLGDYVDRGPDSLGVLFTCCRLKNVYPDSVILLRGNHEAPAEFPLKTDLPVDIMRIFGTANARQMYDRILELFRQMPLMVKIKNYFVLVHGGVPAGTDPDKVKKLLSENDAYSTILEDMLWNDPRVLKEGVSSEPSYRGYGRHVGLPVTQKWIELAEVSVIVRGHEHCKGFKVDHAGRVLTLYSATDIPKGSRAGFLHITKEKIQSIKDVDELGMYVRMVS